MDIEELVAKFGRHVDAGSATVFVGAGLSQGAGYPGWAELTESFQTELGIEPLQDLPQLAQYFVAAVAGGRDRLDDQVRAALMSVGEPPPTPSHLLLAQLPITELWTTNFENLLERSLDNPQVFVVDEDLAGPTEPGRRRVYKMHGSLDPPGPLVLTRDDYERYPWTHPRFWALLQAQFLTRSFLFLGFSFTDPNLEVIFRLVRLHAREIHREHFAVMRRPAATGDDQRDAKVQRLFELRVADLGRVGVHVAVIDDHAEVELLLRRLVARCRPSQLMVVGSAPALEPRAPSGPDYPTAPLSDTIVATAKAIAVLLVDTGIDVVGAGEVAAQVGYQLLRQLKLDNAYSSRRFTLVRRVRDEPVSSPNLRLGEIVFTGDDPTDLRSSALSQVRALLVIGGDEGTASEVDRAEADGLGVVPVGRTGGTAEVVWNRLNGDLDGYRLGGRPVDPTHFRLLMSPDVDAAARATVRLLRQALFLP